MTERNMDANLRSFLIDNEPFSYGHLVIFEKPVVSGDTTPTFSYFTDSSININFDAGYGSGSKTYIANKLLKIGTINETIEAKASSLSLTLAADTIGAITSFTADFTSGTSFTSTEGFDFIEEGFREGDRINLSFTSEVECTIVSFTNGNQTVHVDADVFTPHLAGTHATVATLITEEIVAMYGDLNYVNRVVTIFKVYYDNDGTVVGDPFLLFKGIIATGKLTEDIERASTVTWTLTSHWGDFVRIQGRLTSDSFHRALSADGISDPESLLRPEYSTDRGFEHSEKAISLISVYNRTETRYSMKTTWYGKAKMSEYQVQVPTELDLNFNLQAKYLPVIYGVRKVDSIPVFVDLDKTDPNTVYLAYAICEGEVAGIYDIYMSDSPLVCTDALDAGARDVSIAGDAIEVPCYGRADRGDVLAGNYSNLGIGWFTAPNYSVPATRTSTELSYLGDTEATYYDEWYIDVTNSVTGLVITTLTRTISADGDLRGLTSDAARTSILEEQYSAEANFTYYTPTYKRATFEIVANGLEWDLKAYDYNDVFAAVGASPYATYAEAYAAKQQATGATGLSHGLVHDSYIEFDKPLASKVQAYTGKPYQQASDILVDIAANNDFLMQDNYYEGTPSEYWDASHKLLDTCYVVAKFIISEGETTLPTMDFVVKGKTVECYNYDGSYAVIDTPSNDDESNFLLGDTVDLYELVEDPISPYGLIQTGGATSATIIDRFPVHLPDNKFEWRFIFDVDVEAIGSMFRMINGIYQYSFGNFAIATDRRVSLNPSMQLLDYLTSAKYGKDLNLLEDINIDTFKDAANQCDLKSDVTVFLSSSLAVGEVLTYAPGGIFLFQGTVLSTIQRTTLGRWETVLTNCIGKLGTKWNDYIPNSVGQMVWYKGEVREDVTGGVKTTFASVGALVTSLVANTTAGNRFVSFDGGAASGNSIVKSYNEDTDEYTKSGYSLYDSDDVKYWKYVGWDSPDQRWVTRHQMNQVIRTDAPLFDNVNLMLEQFNGMLRFSNGRYELAIKTQADPAPTSPHIIAEADIIGSIQLTDNATKNTFNNLSAAIIDPQNHFGSRSVSYFNSEYLKEDKGIQKQGRSNLIGITNYYNARYNVKQQLDDSRFKKTIAFKMTPKGYLLLPGSVIYLDYTRFDWSQKEFRITTINLAADGLVSITADEHSDDIYAIPNLNSEPAPIDFKYARNVPVAPTGLTATTDQLGLITLNWTLDSGFDPTIDTMEVFSSSTNDRDTAVFTSGIKGDVISIPIDMADIVGESLPQIDKYYWIRVSRTSVSTVSGNQAIIYSTFEPSSTTAGVLGTALPTDTGRGAININVTNPITLLPTTYDNIVNYDTSGTDIYVYEYNDILTYDAGLTADGTFNIVATSSDLDEDLTDDITVGTITWDTDHIVVGNHSGFQADLEKAVVTYTITVRNNAGVTFDPFIVTQELQKLVDVPGWSFVGQPEAFIYTTDRGFLLAPDLAEFAGFSVGVDRSGIAHTYDASGIPAVDTFKYNTVTPSNVTTSVDGSGVITITGGTLATVATTIYGSVTVEIYDNNISSVVGTKVLTITKDVLGVNWSVNGTNENHTFESENGLVSDLTGYACAYTVLKNGSIQTYDIAGAPESETWKYAALVSSQTLGVDDLDTTITAGVITIDVGSPLSTDPDINTATLTVDFIDNYDASTIATRVISITKANSGVRGSGVYTFEESTSGISDVNAALWAGTLTDPAAQDVAQEVIDSSTDGYLRPNDKITVTDNSANLAGTRIYTGSGTAVAATVSAANFSSLVVETFDGSVLVQGTLSADRLAADTTTTNRLYIGSEVVVGNAGETVGSVHSVNKTSLADVDSGFYLQYDGQLSIGNSTNFLTWNGTTLTIEGGIAVGSGEELSDIFPDATNLPDSGADVTVDSFETGFTADSGGIVLGTAVALRSSPLTNAFPTAGATGVWLGTTLGVGKFYVGTSATNYLRYDGTTLEIRGGLVADDIGAGTITAEVTTIDSLLKSTDNTVYLDMKNKEFHLADGNDDYIKITPFSLEFVYDGNAYSSVRRIITGTATAGSTVVWPIAFKSIPSIIVTPNNLGTYDVSENTFDQAMRVVSENDAVDGFDAVAYLVKSGVPYEVQADTTTFTTAAYSATVTSTRSDVVKLYVNVSCYDQCSDGGGADGEPPTSWKNYHDVEVQYKISSSGTWITLYSGSTEGQTALTVSTGALTAGTYDVRAKIITYVSSCGGTHRNFNYIAYDRSSGDEVLVGGELNYIAIEGGG